MFQFQELLQVVEETLRFGTFRRVGGIQDTVDRPSILFVVLGSGGADSKVD